MEPKGGLWTCAVDGIWIRIDPKVCFERGCWAAACHRGVPKKLRSLENSEEIGAGDGIRTRDN